MTTLTELKTLLAARKRIGKYVAVSLDQPELRALIAAVEALKRAADELHIARYFNAEKEARSALEKFGE